MGGWQKLDISKLELGKEYQFKGSDWSPFTCVGKIEMPSPKSPKKYRNRRNFLIKRESGEFESDRDILMDIEEYREL